MKNKLFYWIPTALISLMMLFSAYAYFTNPHMKESFQTLGFPDYLRIELAIAKIIGVLILVIPVAPKVMKEWAYAGFGITFISAFIGHTVSGDPTSAQVMPIVALALLITSRLFLNKN